jgi:hypothetical protein
MVLAPLSTDHGARGRPPCLYAPVSLSRTVTRCAWSAASRIQSPNSRWSREGCQNSVPAPNPNIGTLHAVAAPRLPAPCPPVSPFGSSATTRAGSAPANEPASRPAPCRRRDRSQRRKMLPVGLGLLQEPEPLADLRHEASHGATLCPFGCVANQSTQNAPRYCGHVLCTQAERSGSETRDGPHPHTVRSH